MCLTILNKNWTSTETQKLNKWHFPVTSIGTHLPPKGQNLWKVGRQEKFRNLKDWKEKLPCRLCVFYSNLSHSTVKEEKLNSVTSIFYHEHMCVRTWDFLDWQRLSFYVFSYFLLDIISTLYCELVQTHEMDLIKVWIGICCKNLWWEFLLPHFYRLHGIS